MSEALLSVSDRAEVFLASLEQGDETEYVRGVGIPGPYRKKHYRRAMREKLMAVHWSGKGLCWAFAGAVEKFEAVINYEDRRPAPPDATKRLLAQFKRMDLFGPARKQGVVSEPVPAGAVDWAIE